MSKIYLTGSGPTRGYITGSGIINNPPRTLLRSWDNATGSYPTIMRVNPSGRSGSYKSTYDDTNTVVFQDSFSSCLMTIQAPPEDATKIKIVDSTGFFEIFEIQRGVILGEGNIEVDIGRTKSTKKIADILAKKINESDLKISARPKKNTISLHQKISGIDGNTLVTVEFPKRNYFSRFSAFDRTARRKTITVQGFENFTPETAFSLTGSFTLSTPDSAGADITYPILLTPDSVWADHRIASPNLGPDIVTKSVAKKGVSDYGLTFTKGENLRPFNDSLINISNNDDFFDEGIESEVLEGFSSPLKSKTQIVIELDCEHETTFGMDSNISDDPGYRFHNMVYYNFDEKKWEKQGPGINVDTISGPGSGWVDSKDHHKDFIRDACIGFSRGTQLLESGSIQASRPITNFGFPSHPKFFANKSSTCNISKFINKPFLLEKFTVEYEAEWIEGSGTTGASMYTDNGVGGVSLFNPSGGYNNKAAINNFFILNQRPWAGEYSYKTKMFPIASPWQEGEEFELSGQIPDFARVGIESSQYPDQAYNCNNLADDNYFYCPSIPCDQYPGASGPFNIMIMKMDIVGGNGIIDGFWGPDISSGYTLTIQYTDSPPTGSPPSLLDIDDFIQNSVPNFLGSNGSPIRLNIKPGQEGILFSPPSLVDYFDIDYITLSCFDYIEEFVETSRELVTYGQETAYAETQAATADMYDILDDGLARDLVNKATDLSGATHDGQGNTPMKTSGRFIMKGICQRPERFEEGNSYLVGAALGGTSGLVITNQQGQAYFSTSHTGVRSGLENELSTSRAYTATVKGSKDRYEINDITFSKTFASERVRPHSPYVLLPGDELIFGFQAACPMDFFGAVKSQDGSTLTLSPGATPINPTKIKITLYGSLISNKKEYHDPLNQPLTSDALHESLFSPNDLIDRFDVDNSGHHLGNYLDDNVSGNIFEQGPYASVSELFFEDYNRVTGQDPKETRNCLYIQEPDINEAIEKDLPVSLYDLVSGGPESDPDCSSSRLIFHSTIPSAPFINEQYKGLGKNLFSSKAIGEQWTIPYKPVLEAYGSTIGWKFIDGNIEARGGGGSPEKGVCGGVDIDVQPNAGIFNLQEGSGRITSDSAAIVGGSVNYRTGDFHVRFDGVLQGPRPRVTPGFMNQFLEDEKYVAGPAGHTIEDVGGPTASYVFGLPGVEPINAVPSALLSLPTGFEDPSSAYARGSFSVYALKCTPGYENDQYALGLGGSLSAVDYDATGSGLVSYEPVKIGGDDTFGLSPNGHPNVLLAMLVNKALENEGCSLANALGVETYKRKWYGATSGPVVNDAQYRVGTLAYIPGYYRADAKDLPSLKNLPENLGFSTGVPGSTAAQLSEAEITTLLTSKTKLDLFDISTQQIAGRFQQVGPNAVLDVSFENDPRYLFDFSNGATGGGFSSRWTGTDSLFLSSGIAQDEFPGVTAAAFAQDPGPNPGVRTITIPISCSAEYSASDSATLGLGPQTQLIRFTAEKQAKAIYYSIVSFNIHISRMIAIAENASAARNLATYLFPYDVMLVDTTGDSKYDSVVFESWLAGSICNNPVVLSSLKQTATLPAGCGLDEIEFQNYVVGTASPASSAYSSLNKSLNAWPSYGEYFSSINDSGSVNTEFIGGIDHYDLGAVGGTAQQYHVISGPTQCQTYIDINIKPSTEPDAVHKGNINRSEYWDGTPYDDPALNTFTFRIYFNDFSRNYMSYVSDPPLPTDGGIVMADSGGTLPGDRNFDGGIYVNNSGLDLTSVNWFTSMFDDQPLSSPEITSKVQKIMSDPSTRIRIDAAAGPWSPTSPGWTTLGEIFAWHRLSISSNGGQLRISDLAGVMDDTDIVVQGPNLQNLTTKSQIKVGDKKVQGKTYFEKTRQVKSRATGAGFLPSPKYAKIDMPYPGTKGSFFRNVRLVSEEDRYYDTVTPSPVDIHRRGQNKLLDFFGTHLTVGEPNPADNGEIVAERTKVTCGPESVTLKGHPSLDDDVYMTTLEGCWFTIYDANNSPYNIWYDVIGSGPVGIPPVAPTTAGKLVPVTEIQRGSDATWVAEKTAEAISGLGPFNVEYTGEDYFIITNKSNGAASDVSFPGVVGNQSTSVASLSISALTLYSGLGLVGYGAPGGAGASEDGTGPQTDSGQVVNNPNAGWSAEVLRQGLDAYPGYSKVAIDDNWLAAYPFEPTYSGLLRTEFTEDQTEWDTFPGDDAATENGTFGSSNDLPKFTTMFLTGSYKGHNIPNPWEDFGVSFGAQGFISDSEGNINFGDSKELNENVYKFYFGSGNGWSHSPVLSQSAVWRYIPSIRGWKYGLMSALPLNASAVYSSKTFGQYRDMLEQRLDTTFFRSGTKKAGQKLTTRPAIKCTFIDSAGQRLSPYETQSQNMSQFCTSSMPFFDDYSGRNR